MGEVEQKFPYLIKLPDDWPEDISLEEMECILVKEAIAAWNQRHIYYDIGERVLRVASEMDGYTADYKDIFIDEDGNVCVPTSIKEGNKNGEKI